MIGTISVVIVDLALVLATLWFLGAATMPSKAMRDVPPGTAIAARVALIVFGVGFASMAYAMIRFLFER